MEKLFLSLVCLIIWNCGFGSCAIEIECEPKASLSDTSALKSKTWSLKFCYFDALPDCNGNKSDFRIRPNPDADLISVVQFAENLCRPVETIPRNTFIAFPNVEIFSMSTDLTALHPDDFAHASKLQSLNLRENKIQRIVNGIFSTALVNNVHPLQELLELYLDQNEIASINGYAFYGLIKLRRLGLASNRLTVVRRQTFAGLPSLVDLTLAVNEISVIENGAFDLPHLQTLNLGENMLNRLSDTVFRYLPRLENIHLQFNPLSHIGESLSDLNAVKSVNLQFTEIRDVDLNQFARMPELYALDLSNNDISFGATGIADSKAWNSSLVVLNIANIKLNDVNELEKLQIFPNIEQLDVSNNQISGLDSEDIRNVLPKLRKLKF